MAEFKTVSGQLEGMWNGAVVEAEAAGRRAGAAAAVETVWQVGEKLAGEWGEETAAGARRPGIKGFLEELRRRVGGEPGLQLTAEEWERVHAALEPREGLVAGDARGHLLSEEDLEAARQQRAEERRRAGLPDDRPGFRVGDVADSRGLVLTDEEIEHARKLDEEARLRAGLRPGDVAEPLPVSSGDAPPPEHPFEGAATAEALREADLEARERSTL